MDFEYQLAEIRRIEALLKLHGVPEFIERLQNQGFQDKALDALQKLTLPDAVRVQVINDMARHLGDFNQRTSLVDALQRFSIPDPTLETSQMILRDFQAKHAAVFASIPVSVRLWPELVRAMLPSPADAGSRVRGGTRVLLEKVDAPESMIDDVDQTLDLLESSVTEVARQIAGDEIALLPAAPADPRSEQGLLVVGTAIMSEAHLQGVQIPRGMLHTAARVIDEEMGSGAFGTALTAICQAMGIPAFLVYGAYTAIKMIHIVSQSLNDDAVDGPEVERQLR